MFCSAKDGAVGVALDIDYNPIALDMLTASGFATALNEVRRLKEGGICVIALCCRSFSAMYPSYNPGQIVLCCVVMIYRGFDWSQAGCCKLFSAAGPGERLDATSSTRWETAAMLLCGRETSCCVEFS